MKKVYIGISFKGRKEKESEVEQIKKVLTEKGFHPMVFVDDYVYVPGKDKEMMDQAVKDISESVLLLVELSEKAIGVGLEVGIAAALNIPVLYVYQEDSEYSKTVGGLSDRVIAYKNDSDLIQKVANYLEETFSS
ncbi:MAG: hypothetical protein RLZZ230_333 [Candidatus Parcubacteria bacterium]|jgi:nucleoside 2-deoxyribosyltransferase